MSEPFAEANDADLAEQALPVGDPGDETGLPVDCSTVDADADPADVIEQRQEVPTADDDYDRE